MNNEWNSEVIVEVPDVDITVDQSYDATSSNPQSGTAVAEALGTEAILSAGSGISLSESIGTLTIAADAQLPASTSADAGKVLQVQEDGTVAWVTLS